MIGFMIELLAASGDGFMRGYLQARTAVDARRTADNLEAIVDALPADVKQRVAEIKSERQAAQTKRLTDLAAKWRATAPRRRAWIFGSPDRKTGWGFALKIIIALGLLFFVMSMITPKAHATEPKQMPVDFVGDWCFAEFHGRQTDYQLPSWAEHCGKDKILSITKDGFWINGEAFGDCQPLELRQSRDVAHSGTAYIAKITARCYSNTSSDSVVKRFELTRYKGNLWLENK